VAADDRVRDAFLRHQAALDGFSRTIASQVIEDVRTAIDTVERRLRSLSGESFTRARLLALRPELVRLEADLAGRIAATTGEAVQAVAETAPAAVARATTEITASFVTPSPEVLRQVTERPFDGRDWNAWGRKISGDAMGRLQQELRQAEALGEPIPRIARRLGRVVRLSTQQAETLARTMVNDVGNRARLASTQATLGQAVQGFRYLATLDERTSKICARLDGTTWRVGDPEIQRPPLHPNCRSVLVPTTDPAAVPQGDRPAVGDDGPEVVPARLDFKSWFNRQGAAFQRDFLGPTRFRAFRRGLPLDALATTSRPLNLAELRARFPEVA
jgi:SPP1 gp7 family putative phage head morphogenesis protein